MEINTPVGEGFVPRPNYKRSKSRTGKTYSWLKTPEARFMKIIIGLIGDKYAPPSVVLTRAFSKNGIFAHHLLADLLFYCPWASEEFLKVTGKILMPGTVYDRWHKQFYKNGPPGKGGTPCVSGEYFINHPRLRPFIKGVDERFSARLSTSLAMAKEICREK